MRIALIHAVAAAVPASEAALQQLWPAAEPVNLLDDSLGRDRERAGRLTPALAARIEALADYAVKTGAKGILFTCSAFGEAIDSVARRSPIPVLKPNEALFEEALGRGRRIGLLTTFPSAIEQIAAELEEAARLSGRPVEIEARCVPAALTALRSGDPDRHDAIIAEAALGLASCNVILLGQFSMARAAAAVGARVVKPVLTSPASAVRRLQALVGDEGQGPIG